MEQANIRAMTHSLPQSALDVIDGYLKLKAAENTYVRCPYFRNPRSGRERWGLAVYSGKGSCREIEQELKIIEKLEGRDFSTMQKDDIRDIMKKRKLGIECSGFIVRVLDGWTREFYKKPIYSLIQFNASGLPWLFCKLRPYTHIDIPTLVHPKNARSVEEIQDVMPGDLIRFNSTIDHAALVTYVIRDQNHSLQKILYAQSVFENTNEGVKLGTIEFVSSQNSDLASQVWTETPSTGHTIIEKGEPQIYRLSIVEQAKLWQKC
jgi:hypothetical protein